MAKKPTIVEINGRKYDANTGQLISGTPDNILPTGSNRSIDGFSSHITGTNPNRTRPAPARTVHRATQRSQKLHSAAARPAAKRAPIRAVSPKQAPAKTTTTPVQKATPKVPAERLARAQAQQQSDKISKYGLFAHKAAPAPNVVAAQPAAPTPVATKAQPKPVVTKEKSEKKRRSRLIPAIAVILLVLLGGGYLTYINIPNFSLKIASSRAGIDANLPGYSPDGFKFDGPISYSPGQLVLKFHDQENKEYKISQRESSWDSQSLLDNFVVRENKDYLTFQERGLTVYIYDNNQATWVDGGVWYTIEGNSQLTSEQILKIAGSL